MGGRDKGMAAHYHKYVMQLMNDLGASTVAARRKPPLDRLDFPNEIFYIVCLAS